jgi:hypothetical protein
MNCLFEEYENEMKAMFKEYEKTENDECSVECVSELKYPLDKAKTEYMGGQQFRYKLTVINWTHAMENGKTNHKKVHKFEYIMRLADIIKYIKDMADEAEEVIKIEPENI